MARYIVEREFPEGLNVPINNEGAALCRKVVDKNAVDGVTWVHSYVSADKRASFCVYDGPNEQAIERAAAANGLPVNRIVEVRVLDPYFYA